MSATPAPAAGSSTRSFALKPKVVRRTDDERKALAEQEEKKFNDRAAEDARRRRASRGRGRGRGGRGGRGRGDFSGGRDGLVRRTVAPDGPFSQVPGAAGRGGMRGGQGGFGGGGGGFGSGGGRGAGGGGGGGNFSMASGGAEIDSRLNTDMFNGRGASAGYHDSDGFKDEYASGAAEGGAAGRAGAKKSLLPMGIRREEHREPEVVVTTTAELEAAAETSLEDASDSELFIDNSDAAVGSGAAGTTIEDDYQVWSRAIKTQGSVKLVGADGVEVEITDIDTLAAKRQELAAAAAARGETSGAVIKREDGDEEMISLDSVSEQPSAAARTAVAKKPKTATVATAAAPAAKKDPEDLAIEEGLQAMLHDLAMDPPQDPSARPPQVMTIDGSEEQEPPEPQEQKPPPAREGRLFLFQFPPVLPSLKAFEPGKDGGNSSSSNNAADPSGGGIKSEPGTGDDVVMLDGVAPAPIDLTDSETAGSKRNAPSDIGGGGFLGTLSIRKSGRAELSWGGMTYEMMPGADVQFLTTAVLLEESDEKREGGGQAALVGNAFGMGPVGGKYNLVPVFSEESEWTVDPSELVVEDDEEYDEEEE